MEIEDYVIISSTGAGVTGNGIEIKYVQDKVKQYLEQGWHLFGPIVVSSSSQCVYVQTMVKYKVPVNEINI